MRLFEKIVNKLTVAAAYVAQFAMAFAMLIIVGNVITREFWKPIPGTVELVEMSGAVLLSMAVSYTAIKKGHIMVGVLLDKFSARVQAVVDGFIGVITLVFLFLLTREAFAFAERMMSRNYITGHLNVPIAPSIYIVGVGFSMLCLVLLLDIMKSVITAIKGVKQT